MSLGTMEQRTEGMKKQANELIEQAYQRGFKAGYSKAENDYHAKTEDDRQSSYELGLNMAWEAAKKTYLPVICGGLSGEEVEKIFGVKSFATILQEFSASEAIEKLSVYEEQKKQEEDEVIYVGDEVVLNANSSSICDGASIKAIVIMNDGGDFFPYKIMAGNGDTAWIDRDDIDRKTGRYFPEISEVLKKIQEDDN